MYRALPRCDQYGSRHGSGGKWLAPREAKASMASLSETWGQSPTRSAGGSQ